MAGDSGADHARCRPPPPASTTPPSAPTSQAYEALQARIKGAQRPAAARCATTTWHKAQCWLDVSFHEYTRNDRSAFPQAALTEGRKARSCGRWNARQQPSAQADTPLVATAPRASAPTCGQRAAALRGHATAWPCAQATGAACAEVELVHAGHEIRQQQGWRHARPYVQTGRGPDRRGRRPWPSAACRPGHRRPPVAAAPAVVPPAPAARPVAPAPVVARDPNEVLLFAQVVFRFDRVSLGDIAVGGLVSVQDLLQRLRDDRLVLQSVQLSGHADRLNGTGRTDYNQSLSERRVASVRDFLVAQGIPADRIRLDARGDRQPRASCEALAGTALQDCLLPDRRVEVLVTTRRP
jgi:OOP family OmpA-OmpF porin